jgi:hypothetical protein
MELMDLIAKEIERRKSFDNDLAKMGATITAVNCVLLDKDNYYKLMLDKNANIVSFTQDAVQDLQVVNYKGTEYFIGKEFEKNE